MQVLVAGIDVAKDSLHVVVQKKGDDRPLDKGRPVANTLSGQSHLQTYLTEMAQATGADRIEVFLESTGVYADRLCHFLYQVPGVSVHVVPPDRLSHYLKAMGNRGKTDALDAKGIARFGAHHDWTAWKPHLPEIDELRHLIQAIEALKVTLVQVGNRLHADQHRSMANQLVIRAQKQLERQIQTQIVKLQKALAALIRRSEPLRRTSNLLQTIPGIGLETAASVLAMIGDGLPASVKQWVGYVGMAPRPRESGTSVRGRATISPSRGRALRKMLYMGILVAVRYNPALKAFYDSLVARGKPKKLALTACMRKQLHIIYGVLRNDKPFDLNCLQPA